MITVLVTFSVFIFIMAIMAVGYIVAGKSIKGSCGGLNAIEGLDGACDMCAEKTQCSQRKRLLAARARQNS